MAKGLTDYQRRVLAAAADGEQLRYYTSLCTNAKSKTAWRIGGFGTVRSSAAKALIDAKLVKFSAADSTVYTEMFSITEAGKRELAKD